MSTGQDEPGPTDRSDVGEAADRALRAQHQARELAARLADTALDVAATLDQVADVREVRAGLAPDEEVADRERVAQRARDEAEGERRESRRLRSTWGLSDGGAEADGP